MCKGLTLYPINATNGAMMMLMMYDEVVGSNESSAKSPCFKIQKPSTKPDDANFFSFFPDICRNRHAYKNSTLPALLGIRPALSAGANCQVLWGSVRCFLSPKGN